MGYTAPTTITTGQLVTAALMNAEWVENIKFLANPPAAARRQVAAQSMTNAADTIVNFDTTDKLVNGVTIPAVNRIQVPVAGVYMVSGSIRVAGNATAGFDEASIYVYNSSDVFQASWYAQGGPANIAGVDAAFNPGGPIWLNAGDRVALRFWTNKGTRNNTVGGVGHTRLAVVWVGLG